MLEIINHLLGPGPYPVSFDSKSSSSMGIESYQWGKLTTIGSANLASIVSLGEAVKYCTFQKLYAQVETEKGIHIMKYIAYLLQTVYLHQMYNSAQTSY
jgi:hypothetical protein